MWVKRGRVGTYLSAALTMFEAQSALKSGSHVSRKTSSSFIIRRTFWLLMRAKHNSRARLRENKTRDNHRSVSETRSVYLMAMCIVCWPLDGSVRVFEAVEDGASMSLNCVVVGMHDAQQCVEGDVPEMTASIKCTYIFQVTDCSRFDVTWCFCRC